MVDIWLRKLTLAGFKNYREAEFEFSAKINCFVGNNGAGKTNLLDAIHYLSFCKSYFSSLDLQNIRHGDELFAIHGQFERGDGISDLVQCIQRKNQRKRFMVNRKEYDRLADHIGIFPLVMISPYDRDLINDGSELRRKYIDSVISQFDRLYLDDLIQYNKALANRNALLKSFSEQRYFDAVSLEMWDEPMIRLGTKIAERRIEFLDRFVPLFRQYYGFVSNGNETVDIRYVTQREGTVYADAFRAALDRDRVAGSSTLGIHKDDFDMAIDGYPVKRFGSQGQQKSFVIAVKLAQFEYTRNIKGFKPILLLDDIFDKLDDRRVTQLIRLVSENSFGQVFITDTSRERILTFFQSLEIDHQVFRIPEDSTGNDREATQPGDDGETA
ncbi:MAG TPA: DNA replication/repair protein RecF [Bacteroidales bacterium]|nr:DNA replication/repair protein RecF [Bacteroidales bacterium]HPS62351.1 DNA replication/repair protein RecF [Bacteroidales bacterium]